MRCLVVLVLLLGSQVQNAPNSVPRQPSCKVVIEPDNLRLKEGEKAELHIVVSGAANLFSAPFYVVYDPGLLMVEDVLEADFLRGDGKQTAFAKSVQPENRRIIIGLARLGDVGGRTGSGRLVTLKVQAKQKGEAKLSLERLDFRNSELKVIPVATKPAQVIIQ